MPRMDYGIFKMNAAFNAAFSYEMFQSLMVKVPFVLDVLLLQEISIFFGGYFLDYLSLKVLEN